MSLKSFSLSTVLSVLGAAALIGTLGACSSDPKKSRDDMNSTAGAPPPIAVDNIGSAGMAGGSAGSAGSAGTTASGSSGSGGSAGSAGTAGSTAGSSGSGSSSAGSGGSAGSSSAGSSADAGVAEDDPIGDLLGGGGQTSCEGLVCLEATDCADLYPDENATCKFTDCVDFMCK